MAKSGKKHTDTTSDDAETKKDIPNVTSDVYFKQCMSNISMARDFFTFNMPEKIKSRINLESLALAPQEYLTAALRRRAADAVYTVNLKNSDDEVGYILIHIEHQTKPQRKMPLRMLEFMLTMMRQISENHPDGDSAPIPVVIPIILSNHSSPYPYSVRFLDLFTEAGQALVSSMLNGDLPLVDLANTPDDVLKNHLGAAIMEMALKHVKNSEMSKVLYWYAELLQNLAEQGFIDQCEAREITQDLVCYMYDNLKKVPRADEIDDLLATFEHQLPLNTGEVIVTLREHFIDRGVQQGMHHVVLNMLKKGFTDNQICDCAEISIDELEALKQRCQEESDSQH